MRHVRALSPYSQLQKEGKAAEGRSFLSNYAGGAGDDIAIKLSQNHKLLD